MISSLRIMGFQSHENLNIRLGRVTTIIGPNSAGKSAVIRALRWLCLNRRPVGEFINWSKRIAKVKLNVDGRLVVRQQSRGKQNFYKLNDRVFKSFAYEVPDDIKKVLHVSSLNFQRQHDAPFWFCLSPGQVSKELNSIVNLDIIDRSLSEASSRLRKATLSVEMIEARLSSAIEKERNLRWAVEADYQLSEIEDIEHKLKYLSSSIQSLKSVLSSYQNNKLLVFELRSAVAMYEGAFMEFVRARQISTCIRTLKGIISKLSLYEKLSSFPVATLSIRRLEALALRASTLRKIISEFKDNSIKLDNLSTLIDEKKSEIAKLTQGKCPICGRELKL